MSEHALQIGVAQMLRTVLDPEKTWWTAIDHAARLSLRYGAERKRRGVKRGLPDIMIFLIDGLSTHLKHHVIGIELKTDKGRLTPEQVDTALAWTMMGHVIYVARSLEEVYEILEFCRVPMRSRMTFLGGGDGRPTRAAAARHPRARRPRKSKAVVPLVLGRTT